MSAGGPFLSATSDRREWSHGLSGERPDADQLAHAFVVALLVIATTQLIGAVLGLTIARQPAPILRRALI